MKTQSEKWKQEHERNVVGRRLANVEKSSAICSDGKRIRQKANRLKI